VLVFRESPGSLGVGELEKKKRKNYSQPGTGGAHL
jgi:hypothetical protein